MFTEQHTIGDHAEEKVFCPSCFLSIKGDSVLFGEGVHVHSFPGCLMNWARYSEQEQNRRVAESQRIADSKDWSNAPSAFGPYWARRADSDVLASVTVLQGVRGLVVKCGNTLREISGMDGYLYLPRIAQGNCKAA